jgi:hypothetical protein
MENKLLKYLISIYKASSEGDPPDEIHTPRRLQTKEFARGKNSKGITHSMR